MLLAVILSRNKRRKVNNLRIVLQILLPPSDCLVISLFVELLWFIKPAVCIFSSSSLHVRFSAVKLLHLGLLRNCKVHLFSNFSRWLMIYANLSILAHLQFDGAIRSTPSQGPLPTSRCQPVAIRRQSAPKWGFGAKRGLATRYSRGLLKGRASLSSGAQPPTTFLISLGPRTTWSTGRGFLNLSCWAKGRSGRSLNDPFAFLDLTFYPKRLLGSLDTLLICAHWMRYYHVQNLSTKTLPSWSICCTLTPTPLRLIWSRATTWLALPRISNPTWGSRLTVYTMSTLRYLLDFQ